MAEWHEGYNKATEHTHDTLDDLGVPRHGDDGATLYIHERIRAYGDKRAREAAEDVAKAFWIAMQQSWQMIDPLRPPAPGSYWMGEHNGIAAALKTVRENFERELQELASAPTPGDKT